MIPRTFPSSVADNGSTQMVVYFLPNVSGLVRWTDYIPVQYSTVSDDTTENTYNQDGYIPVVSVSSIEGATPFKEYVPVFVDSSADPADVWKVNITGFIPVGTVGIGGTSLSLNFAASTALDPRVTFSRTTNATVTGPDGLIAYAPHNLLTFSEQFDNAAWAKTNATISANTTVAPDSTTTADKLVEDTANASHVLTRGGVSVTSGTAYTYTLYAKAAERTIIRIAFGLALPAVACTVSLVDGSVSDGTPTVQSVGDGWWRISLTATAASTANAEIYAAPRITSGGGISAYQGDGTSGLFIWGAQLEQSSTASAYNPTTVKNLLGFTEHFDNAAWIKSNAFVQTNLVTYSEQFNNADWTKFNLTIAANDTVSPDGSLSADKLVENTANGRHDVYTSSSLTLAAHTMSVYAKKAERSWIKVRLGSTGVLTGAWFDLENGAVGSVDSGYTANITDAGNGWYRCSITVTTTSALWFTSIFVSNADNVIEYEGDGTSGIYIWGAQLVQGTSAGDYKATYAAAAAVGYTDIYGQPFAQKLVESTANSDHLIGQNISPTTGKYTASVYAKAGERTLFNLGSFNGRFPGADFDLAAVTATPTGSSSSATITDVGGGWYRCTATREFVGGTDQAQIRLRDSAGNLVYTGDGTSGIYLFGAQLSDSASVDPYVYQPVAAPTSTAYYGPRFDYDASTATITESYGPELITNGDFSNGATGWLLNPTGSNVITISGGAVRFQTTGADTAILSQAGVTTAGKFYKIEFDVLPGSSGLLKVLPLGTSGEIVFSCTPGRKTFGITVATSTLFAISRVVGQVADAYIDNITVKEYLDIITGTGATPKGLLIEEQRTNLLTYSEQFDNAAWAKGQASVSVNAVTSPDGTQTADALIENSTNNVHFLREDVTTTAQSYSFSVFAKQAGRTWFQLINTTVSGSAYFDLASGVVGTTVSATATIAAYPNGWYKCTITVAATAASNVWRMYLASSNEITTYQGDGTSGIYIWGAQLEAGAFATSYIPTVASQVTRATDNASMIGNNFARWYNQTEGTFYADFNSGTSSSAADGIGVGRGVACISDNTISNRFRVAFSLNGYIVIAGGATMADITIGSVDANTNYKMAVVYKADDFQAARNAVFGTADTAGSVPVVNRLDVGNSSINGSGVLNGTISRIAYYPRRLANTELQAITS